MSGGVDSSVAALLLKRESYEVIGIHLKLFDDPLETDSITRTCCSIESAERARQVCGILDIPFYVLNYREKFEETVIKPFAKSYIEGKTPNPCIACNRWVKFEFLLREMRAIGIDYLATGHYIRKIKDEDKWTLFRAKDLLKDQSYFLYMLNQAMLDSLLFPNGDYEKKEIRKMASDAGLPVADVRESQDICFVMAESYSSIIESMYPGCLKAGAIVDQSGKELGRHTGIINYTIGQRHGLRVSAPEPLYVLEIRPDENLIVVGRRDETFSKGLNFDEESFVSGMIPPDGMHIQVKIRYNAKPVIATFVGKTSDGFQILFEKSQAAVTPGQAVVLYDGEKMLGGGTIIKALS